MSNEQPGTYENGASPANDDAAAFLDELAEVLESDNFPRKAYLLLPFSDEHPLGKVVFEGTSFSELQVRHPEGAWGLCCLHAARSEEEDKGEIADIIAVTRHRLLGNVPDGVTKVAVLHYDSSMWWSTPRIMFEKLGIALLGCQSRFQPRALSEFAGPENLTWIPDRIVEQLPEEILEFLYARAAVNRLHPLSAKVSQNRAFDSDDVSEIIKTRLYELSAGAVQWDGEIIELPDEPEYQCLLKETLLPATLMCRSGSIQLAQTMYVIKECWQAYQVRFGVETLLVSPEQHPFFVEQAETDGVADAIRQISKLFHDAIFADGSSSSNNKPLSSNEYELDVSEKEVGLLYTMLGTSGRDIVLDGHETATKQARRFSPFGGGHGNPPSTKIKDSNHKPNEWTSFCARLTARLIEKSGDPLSRLTVWAADLTDGILKISPEKIENLEQLSFDNLALITLPRGIEPPRAGIMPMLAGLTEEYDGLVGLQADFDLLGRDMLEELFAQLDIYNIDYIADAANLGVGALYDLNDFYDIIWDGPHASSIKLKDLGVIPKEVLAQLKEIAYDTITEKSWASIAKVANAPGFHKAIPILSFGHLSYSVEEAQKTNMDAQRHVRTHVRTFVLSFISDIGKLVKDDPVIFKFMQVGDVVRIWSSYLQTSGMKFSRLFPLGVEAEKLSAVGTYIGVDSAIEAYFTGVPLEDLLRDLDYVSEN